MNSRGCDNEKMQAGYMKFCQNQHIGTHSCKKNNNRKRESSQRALPKIERRMLSLLKREAGEEQTITRPLRYYAGELRITRQKVRNTLRALEARHLIQIKDEWQEGILRMKVCLRKKERRGYESKTGNRD